MNIQNQYQSFFVAQDKKALELINSPEYDNAVDFCKSLNFGDAEFKAQEDTLFDYKKTFPFSMSDDYFAAIARLILSFYNSFGGVVIFGVEDDTRLTGKNSVRINIERLNTRIREISGLNLNARHISLGEEGEKVDLVIIPKRPANVPPAKLLSSLSKYKKGTIWIRKGHETLEAGSDDIGFLFKPREITEIDDDNTIIDYLPATPSTIRNFVGRIDILSELMNWVAKEDEPRKYLHGRGGSGKSTLAYEFAKIIRDSGKVIKTQRGLFFDRVVFVSAKEKELNTQKAKIQNNISTDFSNFEELCKSILVATDYTSDLETINNLSKEQLISSIKEVFNYESILLIIDDIDTLTTKNLTAGFDTFYRLALRAKRDIRILYTQRNQPTDPENSILVEGFTLNDDLAEFVKNCCDQFKIDQPKDTITFGILKENSEGIPLIIETIVGLAKVCGGFENGIKLFMERSGDESRRYLFDREYEALPNDNIARKVLSVISEFNRSVSFNEITNILEFSEDNVTQALYQTLGFFLSTNSNSKGEIKYTVNHITKIYLKEKTKNLAYGENIISRVKTYLSGSLGKSEEIALLEREIRVMVKKGDINGAIVKLEGNFKAKIAEDPRFKLLRAKTYCEKQPTQYERARADFRFCTTMGYEDVDGVRSWYRMEKEAESSYIIFDEICDSVIEGKTYEDIVKYEFLEKRTTARYFHAKNIGDNDAFKIFESCMIDRVKCYRYFKLKTRDYSDITMYTRNLAFGFFQCGGRLNYDIELYNSFFKCLGDQGFIESPLIEPFIWFLNDILSKRSDKSFSRIKGLGNKILKDLKSNKIQIENTNEKQMVIAEVKKILDAK